MSVRQVKVHGKKRWQARVAYQGGRLSRLCDSKDAAKQAEADLLKELAAAAEQETQENAAPATLELLCEAYELDLEARGKAPDSITRAKDTVKRLEEFLGARMQDPLGKLTEADLYAYRASRLQHKIKAGTINRDFRTIRAMLKKALPGFRFPAGVFLPEDETRVKWLRPEDELVVFATMPAPFGDLARLAAITMMRLTEIRTLRRWQVDLGQGVVTLPRTKTTPRHVVLNAGPRGSSPGRLRLARVTSCSRIRTASPTRASISGGSGGRPREPPGSPISTFTTSGTTGRPWP